MKKKNLLIGIVLVLLAGFCLLGYLKLEDYGMDRSGKYRTYAITGADVSGDETYVAVADSMETVLFLNQETEEIQWMKSIREICGGYARIQGVFLDELNRVYVDVLRYDEDYKYAVEEVLFQYDTQGNECARLVIPETASGRTDSSVRGFKCKDGFLYYYNESIKQLVRMDLKSGETQPYGNYDTARIDDAFALGFTEDDTITLAFTDGTLALGKADGTIETVGIVPYEFGEEENGILVNQYVYFDGRHYVTDGRYFESIYQIEGDVLNQYIDINGLMQFDAMLMEDYYSFVLNHGMSVTNNANGRLLIHFANCLFYTADMETFVQVEDTGAYALPMGLLARIWFKMIFHVLSYVLGIIGLVLLVGSVMKWRFSLRSKLFVIIMPITLGGILLVTYYEMNAIEQDFKQQQYEEYDAISAFYQNQLDKDTLYAMQSLEDAQQLEELRLRLMENMQPEGSWSDRVDISVIKYFENGMHLVLYSTTTDCLFSSTFQFDFENNSQYRVDGLDTYHYETKDVGSTYLDSITCLRDENGEIYAFIDVFGNMDRLQISQNRIKKKVAVISVILGLILGTLLYILAYYIIRNLRMTSKTVGEIAQGNLEARVAKITKDELGVIGAGVNDMADKIEALFGEQEEFSTQVIETLVGTIDAKDKYTNGHSKRVAKYSQMIAQKLGKDQKECRQVYYAGLLHDIGKIGVPDGIINKTARLDDEEYKIIKTHPEIGYRLLCNLTQIENLSIGAHYHHERYDGKGYPDGLAGEEIPEIARIIAAADCYDAMTSNRSYRKAMSQEKVRGEMEKGKGTQFDPLFAEKMLEIDMEIAEIIYYN